MAYPASCTQAGILVYDRCLDRVRKLSVCPRSRWWARGRSHHLGRGPRLQATIDICKSIEISRSGIKRGLHGILQPMISDVNGKLINLKSPTFEIRAIA